MTSERNAVFVCFWLLEKCRIQPDFSFKFPSHAGLGTVQLHHQVQKAKLPARVWDSRLSLTSQMGCNRLINPMFVSFYAFYYGLFSLRAISSADWPSLGEGTVSKTLLLPDQCYFFQDVESHCVLPELSSTSHESDWSSSSIIFHACRPRCCSFHSSPFHSTCLARCYVINAVLPSSVQGLVKRSFFLTALRSNKKTCLDILKCHLHHVAVRYSCICIVNLPPFLLQTLL